MQLLGSYLAHCHVGAHRPLPPTGRDAKGTAQWTWEGCPMADGLYHFPTLVAQLRRVGYRHFISIEDFRSASPEEKLQNAIAYLRSLEQA